MFFGTCFSAKSPIGARDVDPDSIELLKELASARSIPFHTRRLPSDGSMVTSDGIRLHYLDWPGDAETLLLLHGGALSARTFDLLALALGDNIRCVALDLRGHGDSGWAEHYSVERWSADAIELIGHLGLASVHLAGMSLGGCIAGHTAVALGRMVKSLTFIDVADDVNAETGARIVAFIDGVRPAESVEVVVWQALAASPQSDPALMRYRYRSLLKPGSGGFTWRADRRSPPNFAHILAKLAELSALADRIACPTLVVKGGRSQTIGQVALERFAEKFPNGTWTIIRDAGHNIQEDAPVALASALRQVMSA